MYSKDGGVLRQTFKEMLSALFGAASAKFSPECDPVIAADQVLCPNIPDLTAQTVGKPIDALQSSSHIG